MKDGSFFPKTTLHYHVKPFEGANIEPSAIKFNGIDIDNPFRLAVSEERGTLTEIFEEIKKALKDQRSVHGLFWWDIMPFLTLDLSKRQLKGRGLKSPFHQFSTIDTVSLSALYCGETVLAKAISKIGIEWDNNEAHSALYDTQKTSELFCEIFNSQKLGILK